jgi:hypothetical protein
MTMDHTILVDDDFDPDNPEDQALYAHERHHQLESGGADHPHDGHDAEEMAARAIESMVLHRRAKGDSLSSILRDVKGGSTGQESGGSDPSTAFAGAASKGEELTPAQRGYVALRSSGKSHEEIVEFLAQALAQAELDGGESQDFRAPLGSF